MRGLCIISNMNRHAVREAEPRDAEAINELERRCYPPEDVFSPKRIRFLLKSRTCLALVIRGPHREILANVIGLLRHFPKIPSGRVYKITIDPSLRGLGLATRLIKTMEGRFKRAGMMRVCAEVRESNRPSRKLFEGCGYVATNSLQRYYPDGENGTKYWKTLAPT